MNDSYRTIDTFLERHRAGDPSAGEQFRRLYGNKLYRVIQRAITLGRVPPTLARALARANETAIGDRSIDSSDPIRRAAGAMIDEILNDRSPRNHSHRQAQATDFETHLAPGDWRTQEVQQGET